MASLPTLSKGEDSEFFSVEYEDKAVTTEMDGGYKGTRPRHTRRPRRTWTTGYTDLSQADIELLEGFINTHGTYLIFDYVVPTTEEEVRVRLQELPQPKYVGKGGNHRWDVPAFKIEEV